MRENARFAHGPSRAVRPDGNSVRHNRVQIGSRRFRVMRLGRAVRGARRVVGARGADARGELVDGRGAVANQHPVGKNDAEFALDFQHHLDRRERRQSRRVEVTQGAISRAGTGKPPLVSMA